MSTEPIPNLVSVVIPAYNAEAFIEHAIGSVLAQTYEPVEVIVVNDGSTDRTVDRVASYKDSVRLVNQRNLGLSRARNAGIRAATGEFVAFLDADDYWKAGKLSCQVELLRARPALGFCSTAAVLEDAQGNCVGEWGCPEIRGTILHTIFMRNAAIPGSGSGVMARAAILRQVGDFDPALGSLEDIDMWMRLAAVSEYVCVPEPLTVIYRRGASMSGNLDVMRASAVQVMRKNRHLLPARDRRAFWRAAYAGVLADYAKWEYRSGRRADSVKHLLQALLLAPVSRGRLTAGLLVAAFNGSLGRV